MTVTTMKTMVEGGGGGVRHKGLYRQNCSPESVYGVGTITYAGVVVDINIKKA